ncbi:MAG TPA: TIGR01777 family oxidoreductase [Acidimicrobiales bacterium]|nr:TIGR01777 family oxidoreductase [Acidimicrobiales bacterium]
MDVAVTGASGFIGTALVAALSGAGHGVRRLVRRSPASPEEVGWDPAAGTIDAEGLAGVDAVVHLAGEGIASRRWTDGQKARILESRRAGTRLIAETLAGLDPRPAVLVSGSGIDYYGDRGDEELTEDSPPGSGFLPEVCLAWEGATAPAAEAGIRTAVVRTGMVLHPGGGALPRLLPLFKLGLGGRFGSGRQWWPWISLEDEVGAIVHALTTDVSGPVNGVAPQAVTNAQFTRILARVLQRPAVVPVPKFGPGLVVGPELAQALLFDSKRALPTRLLESGYRFAHPTVEEALRAILDRPAR